MSKDLPKQLAIGLERLSDLLRAHAWKQRETSGLNPTQRSVLTRLAERDQPLRLKALAQSLGVSSASVSDSVKSLEARGYLRRQPDPGDARAILVSPTASGLRSLSLARSDDTGALDLVAGLSRADQGELLRLLQLLIHRAQDTGTATGFRTCLGCRFFRPYASGDPDRPHLCDYIGSAFGHHELRIDCAEHEADDPETVAIAARRLADPHPS